jgi:hypothetical protein
MLNSLDFYRIADTSLGTYVSQWVASITYCLDEYGQVFYLTDDTVLFREIKTSHLSHGIGFLKKPLLVPYSDECDLLSRDVFFCSSHRSFRKYSKLLLTAHEAFTKEAERTDHEDPQEAKSKFSIKNYWKTLNQAAVDFIRESGFEEATVTIAGQFLASEDFYGMAQVPMTFKDVDDVNLKLTRRIDQPILMDMSASIVSLPEENDCRVTEESELAGFIIRTSLKDTKAVQANALFGRILEGHFPRLVPLLSFWMHSVFPVTYPPPAAKFIAHWDRRGKVWYESLIRLMKTWSNVPFVKLTDTSYRFIVATNPVLCEPSMEFLSPDLVTRKDIMLANLNFDGCVVKEIDKYGLPHSFVFYYPEDSEKLDCFVDGNSSVDWSEREVEMLVAEDVSNLECYDHHIKQLNNTKFVVVEADKFNGCIIAEALAAGCCIVTGEGVRLGGLEEGVHYITMETFSNDSEYRLRNHQELSDACREYYCSNLSSSVLIKRILHHCFSFDMKILPQCEETNEVTSAHEDS